MMILGALMMQNTWFAGIAALIAERHGPWWQVAAFVAYFLVSFLPAGKWVALWALAVFATRVSWWECALFVFAVSIFFFVVEFLWRRNAMRAAQANPR